MMTRLPILLTVPVLALTLVTPHAFAAQAVPPGLVEVTAKNKPNCVEYYSVNGKSYCSTKALSHSNGGVTQFNYDRVKVAFDQRSWVPAWGKNGPDMVTVEYVVKGDDINSWDELITSQYMPGAQNRTTPSEFANRVMQGLKQQVPGVKTTVLESSPKEVIFEFKIDQPKAMAQHEVQRAFWKDDGIYVVHYVIKKPDMGTAAKTAWVSRLKQATPKP